MKPRVAHVHRGHQRFGSAKGWRLSIPSIIVTHNRRAQWDKLVYRDCNCRAHPVSAMGPGKGDSNSDTYHPAVIAAIPALFGSVQFGYHLGVVNGALLPMAQELGFATIQQSVVVSAVLVGAAIGSLISGRLLDSFGRRKAIACVAAPCCAFGGLATALSTSFDMTALGRLIAGLGIGIISAGVPTYITEISPPKLRGRLGSLVQLSICAGILLSIVAGIPVATNPSLWRHMFLASALLAPFILLLLRCPESPTWLLKVGRKDDCRDASMRLWNSDETATMETSNSNVNRSGALKELLKQRREALMVGVGLFFFQQLAGINAVVYFSTYIFSLAGIKNSIVASSLIAVTNLLMTVFSSSVVDKRGRRVLLKGSFSAMGISMVMLSILKAPSLQILFTLVYIASFSMGCGPIPALLIGEIFPTQVRATAASICLFTHWGFNFLVGISFLPLVQSVGMSVVYRGFALACFCAVLFIEKFVKETTNRSLEDIEADYIQKEP